MTLELDPEKGENFSVRIQEKKTVSADVEWCQGEKAQVVACQVVWIVDVYTENSGR